MRFKFCGDLDAPDWLLADIALLSTLTNIKLKLAVELIIKDLLGVQKIEYDKLLDRISKIKSIDEQKSAIATLSYIISNASRFNVSDVQLSEELQQLGLPKESSEALARSYKKNREKLVEKFKTQTLKLPTIEELKWRIDFVLSSSKCAEVNEPVIQMSAKVRHNGKTSIENFDLSVQKFRVLYNELKAARKIMADLKY